MTEMNTTSINDLPTDPANGGSVGGNISLVTNEIKGMNTVVDSLTVNSQQGQSTNPLSLDQSTISQIVNGLQQASLTGITALPSRDIPLNTEQLTHDAYVQPNYVPPPTHRDYIMEPEEDIQGYYKQERIENSLDSLYDELQGPLLLAILYFIFQLPIFKKMVCKYLPFFCHVDGNYNINGLLFTCALFGFIYYSLTKSVKHFSKF
jgi:hypothetical protein